MVVGKKSCFHLPTTSKLCPTTSRRYALNIPKCSNVTQKRLSKKIQSDVIVTGQMKQKRKECAYDVGCRVVNAYIHTAR